MTRRDLRFFLKDDHFDDDGVNHLDNDVGDDDLSINAEGGHGHGVCSELALLWVSS